MNILGTTRLTLREFNEDDATFYLRLVNEPSWLQYIGDKGIRNLEDARAAIRSGHIAMQARYGFSPYLCELAGSGVPIGMCGLIKRDTLPETDLGFAFLPEYWGQGYALEAARAVMQYAHNTCNLRCLLAIAKPDNSASIRLLEQLGMGFEQELVLTPGANPVALYCYRFDRHGDGAAAQFGAQVTRSAR